VSGRRLPALDHGEPKRVLAAAGLSAAGEIAAIGLLATGAWLLFAASLRPPILLLSMAIGAVQLFSFLRGAARYGGKLASHDLGLSFQARSRAWLYRRLERLLPAGLPGGNQGDLLARLISDTEEAQDLVVRAAVPVLAAGAAWCAAVITAGLLLPSAGWVILISGVLGTAGVALAVIIGGRKSAALPAARGAVCAWILGAVASGEELSAMRAEDWALNRLAECERALGAGTRAVAAAAGMARAAAALAGGGGLVIDSRPADMADDGDREAFAATSKACELLGWGYAVCGQMDPVVAANHRWIAAYRHPRCGDPATEARLLEAFGAGLPLMEGAEAAGDPIATLPALFHLMWRRELAADLSLVLSHRTVVRRAGRG